MDSYINNFDSYVKYLKDVIETTTVTLADAGKISNNPIEYNVYDNYGEFTEEAESVKLEESTTPILVCVRNDGGAVDTTSNISTYLQSVSIEILSPMDKKDDISTVFNTIALEYSKQVITIDNKPAVIIISDLPEYSTNRTDVIALERFTITLSCDFIIYSESILSDSTSIYINDVKLPVKSWTVTSLDELEADNKFGYSDSRVKFLSNVNTFVLKIDYLYQKNNPICVLLNTNAMTNSNFNNTYKIDIKYDEAVVLSTTMIHHLTNIIAANGSLLQLSTEFYPYSPANTNVESD